MHMPTTTPNKKNEKPIASETLKDCVDAISQHDETEAARIVYAIAGFFGYELAEYKVAGEKANGT